MNNLKNDNKGISFVEVIAGLAIVGIVASMIATILVSGSRWFTKQGAVVDAQNEVQIINNIITSAVLETVSEIKITEFVAGGYVVTDTGGKKLVYKQDTTSLYVFDAGEAIVLDDGHLLSRWVTDFNVTANNTLELQGILQVDVSYKISNSETEVEQTFSVTPRNSVVSFIVE